ncbi:MAG: ATP-dependent DNA helicase [Pseudomonadales bacterium]
MHQRGDLYPPLRGRVTGEEGIAAQRLAQRNRGESYEREVPVEARFELACGELTVSGRVDGCDGAYRGGAECLVEEIKATRAQGADAEAYLGSAHWAQLRLYAALLARERDAQAWRLRLRYCHPDSGESVDFERLENPRSLAEFLAQTLSFYETWLTDQAAYVSRRNQWLGDRTFPYDGFRPHQRAMAQRAYQALRNDERLLLEAPTGGGKTMGLLFPALKVLAEGAIGQLFFLTSRSTGAIAARNACTDLAEADQRLRHIELIAKEKACPVPGMPCAAERCEYARGYYDRIHAAVRALLREPVMDPETVARVAHEHRTCPFELSLDAALWADVIIGDYNYLLDPIVRLQRFAQARDLGILIDESHQLADRVRDMLSLRLERSRVRAALQESPPEAIARRLRGLDRALLALRRSLALAGETQIDEPGALLRAIARVMQALGEEIFELEAFPATRMLVFELSRWVRSESWRVPGAFSYFASADGHAVCVTLSCLDPSTYLRQVLDGYGAHIRFSGTLTPLPLFQALHGHADTAAERVASGFHAGQLATLIVDDLPVFYRERAKTLTPIADLAAAIYQAQPGNYLIALPSFEYLDAFAARLRERHPELPLDIQRRGMADTERRDFVAAFLPAPATRIGIVVLGGVFGESVDFSHAPLAGVICIGVGLPPVTVQREAAAAYFEKVEIGKAVSGTGKKGSDGRRIAYQQPAMTKIVQMAGRLLRGPGDRGVLCLIDPRFRQADYRNFFPVHWQPEVLRARDVPGRLQAFWDVAT